MHRERIDRIVHLLVVVVLEFIVLHSLEQISRLLLDDFLRSANLQHVFDISHLVDELVLLFGM